MSRFMHFEDNGDDTITLTIGLEEIGEHIFVIPFGFDFLAKMIESGSIETSDLIKDNAFYIPNEPED